MGKPLHIRATPWRTPLDEQVRAGMGELPAYVRRARRCERKIEALFLLAARERNRLLRFVRLRKRQLRTEPAGRRRDRARANLRASIARFNRLWERWIVEESPVEDVNREIEAYNRFYPFERECAVRWVPLDRLEFEKRGLLTRDEIRVRFPPLKTV
jgi:hypothetical protein